MSSLSQNDIKEIKNMLAQVIQNQTVMMAQLVCMGKQTQQGGSHSQPAPRIATSSSKQHIASSSFNSTIGYNADSMFGANKSSLTTLKPMKRKVEIPFEEIEKNGSGGKHRHGAINGEGKFKVIKQEKDY